MKSDARDTPRRSASYLRDAGWTPVNATDWLSPTGTGPHSWPAALLLGDLPRMRHETLAPRAVAAAGRGKRKEAEL